MSINFNWSVEMIKDKSNDSAQEGCMTNAELNATALTSIIKHPLVRGESLSAVTSVYVTNQGIGPITISDLSVTPNLHPIFGYSFRRTHPEYTNWSDGELLDLWLLKHPQRKATFFEQSVARFLHGTPLESSAEALDMGLSVYLFNQGLIKRVESTQDFKLYQQRVVFHADR